MLACLILTKTFLSSTALGAGQEYEDSILELRKAFQLYRSSDFEAAWEAFDEEAIARLQVPEYLYFYKGLAALSLQDKGDEWLEKGFKNLTKAYRLAGRKGLRAKIKSPLQSALESLTLSDYKNGKGFYALKRLESFRALSSSLWSSKWEALYLEGLVQTQQMSRAKALALANPRLLTSSRIKKLKVSWNLPERWHGKKAPLGKTFHSPISGWIKTVAGVRQNFRKIVSYLKKHHLEDDLSPLVGGIARAYAWSHKNKKAGRPFLKEFKTYRFQLPPKVLYGLIDPLWDRGYFTEAQEIGTYVTKHFPAIDDRSKVLYALGRLAQDLGDHKSAIDHFKDYQKKFPQGRHLEASLFNLAFSYFLLKDEKAIQGFESYLSAYSRGGHATGARYFYIRALERHKKKVKYQKALDDLLTTYPLSFYSFVLKLEQGQQRLWNKDLFSDKAPPFLKTSLFPTTFKNQMLLRRVSELKKLELREDAGEELSQFSFSGEFPDLMYYVAKTFEDLGVSHLSLHFLTRLLYVDPNLHPYLSIKKLFPNKYASEIKAISKKQKSPIPVSLIQAQMRQESAFNEKAVSPAGAKGLMQLMPGTAKAMFKAMGEKRKLDIIDPKVNMRLGIFLMGRLLKRYDGNIVYALAAYNAGQTPVERWRKARGHLSPIEFAEAIPYKETRIYVLAILRNWMIYQKVYEQKRGKALEPRFVFKS